MPLQASRHHWCWRHPTVSPNPAQGTSQTFTASFHYITAPLGTPVFFQVIGANPQFKMVRIRRQRSGLFQLCGSLCIGTDRHCDCHARHNQSDFQSSRNHLDRQDSTPAS